MRDCLLLKVILRVVSIAAFGVQITLRNRYGLRPEFIPLSICYTRRGAPAPDQIRGIVTVKRRIILRRLLINDAVADGAARIPLHFPLCKFPQVIEPALAGADKRLFRGRGRRLLPSKPCKPARTDRTRWRAPWGGGRGRFRAFAGGDLAGADFGDDSEQAVLAARGQQFAQLARDGRVVDHRLRDALDDGGRGFPRDFLRGFQKVQHPQGPPCVAALISYRI